MPSWLAQSINEHTVIPFQDMTVHLLFAFAAGWVISLIYRVVRRHADFPTSFPATLVLLTILCAMLPMIIGQNVAWAFGLVGALSIVRFRTAIKDTSDIAFVIFAVLSGMAAGAGQFPVAVMGIVVVGTASFATRGKAGSMLQTSRNAKLTIKIASDRFVSDVLKHSLENHFDTLAFQSGQTRRQGNSIELTYRVRLQKNVDPVEIISQLYRVEGVENVEIGGTC